MEANILTPTQKYAGAALFALALHQSQNHQTNPSNPLLSLDSEPIGHADVTTAKTSTSVSEKPQLWIHEDSGLLLPVFSFLGVELQAWDGLKETAGSSTQLRHHIGSYMKLLSEDRDGSMDRLGKEQALTKNVDATVQAMDKSPASTVDTKTQQSNISPLGVMAAGPANTLVKTGVVGAEMAMDEVKVVSYQRKVTVLYELLSACLADSVKDNGKFFKQREGYDARHRAALRLLACWLAINWNEMEAMESMVSSSLMELLAKANEGDKTVTEGAWEKSKRVGMVSAAALTGGALMAATGGLAAPAIAHGVAALAPVLGGALASTTGSVAVAASFGAAGMSLTGSKMAKRVGGLEEFDIEAHGDSANQGRLGVEIFMNGYVLNESDFKKPFEGINDNMERYIVRWESKNLIEFSIAVEDWLSSKAAMEMMKQGAMLTVLSTLVVALALPAAMLGATELIDTKWAVAIDRADKAGLMLAEVLMKGMHGNRPVTLIGNSLGARAIFKCLQHLAASPGDNGGLVERVVLLGAPVAIQGEKWALARKMVAGRFVNVYSTNDWTLGVTFRASLASTGLAGIQPIEVPGIENIDVTDLIQGHTMYLAKTKEILQLVELESCYSVANKTCSKPKAS
ncbi:unnamed protein product [Linum tenue]|uniref:Uncharacterized protein n=1 Tax=Linum tenue TaxID=586396 RepID=A0AAV0LNK1_9ROSI|nr:unnamed protein product [Linum tenue]